MLKKTVLSLFCCGLLAGTLGVFPAAAASKKKKKAKSEQPAPAPKKTSEYEKLFKEKHETADGMIRLHKVKGKLYFEFPVALLGRDMLLGSTVSEISDNGDAVIGSKPTDPLWIQFTRTGDKVQVRKLVRDNVTDAASPNIARSLANNNIGAIIKSYDIAAWSPDSCAVVFNATDLFLSDNKALTPFDPYGENLYYGRVTRSASYQSDKSFLGEIRAFEDNVVIRSHLSYTYTLKAGSKEIASDVPFTAVMTRSLVLLPETPYEPRFVDSRMSVFPTGKILFSEREQQAKLLCYANRWRVEPSDEAAYRRGELVRPKKPIVFYIDPDFPESWRKPIFEAVEQWNEPFERIGFKQAVEAREFPKDDPEFDPDNIKYSCIRYAPIGISNAMGPSWVDPRSGEIVNASVYVFHDIVKLVNNWRFIQTAQADKSVRGVKLPREVMDDALRYVVTHEVGHCLGFMHNMSASAVIPVDSLRSPSFTQKYGTTYSIMDYARFNHVAQPGDYERGVSMMPPRMGLYDEYAVKWLYTYLPDAKTPEEEQPWLDNLVRSHAGDPIYRYGKQQIFNTLDPTSLSEDLGDDHVRASEYGIRNLKYIMKHLNEWYGEDDNDLTAREAMYKYLLNQYLTYINHVYNVKGGIMMNERKAGDPRPSYSFIDGDYQRRAQQFLIDQLHDLDWLDDPVLLKELPLQGNLSVRVQRILVACIEADKGSFGRMIDPAPNAYSQLEHGDDALKGIFLHTYQGKSLTPRDRSNQNSYVDMLLMITRLAPQKSSEKGIADDERGIGFAPQLDENGWNISTGNVYAEALGDGDMMSRMERQLEADLFGTSNTPEEVGGFGYFRSLTESLSPRDAMYYGRLIKVRDLLRQKRYTGDQETRNHYELLLHRIEGALQ